MRVASSIEFLSHPRFKATWMALAAGSLAGLAVLGACSDAPVSRIAGPAVSAPRLATGTGIVGGTAHKVFVCVDVASDPGPGVGGTYSFAVAMMDPNSVPYPWYELKASNDPDLSIYGVAQNSTGPFDASTDNDVITAALAVAPGDCAEAFVRADTCVGTCDPGDPADHAGNRLWTDVNGVTNPYGSVTITGTNPAGFTMSLSCINDDSGNPQTCINGGYSSANVFHGSTFTYKFEAPPETPCPAGTFTYEIADAVDEAGFPSGGVGDLLIRYDQFPAPNDNSYGINSVGWGGTRGFNALVGSDKAGVQIKNSGGTVILSFNMDYISAVASAPSGYASLGPNGGDGSMVVGTSTGISVTTSLANNLNNINIPGLFSTNGLHTQLIPGTPANNILVNSPPTDPAHSTYVISDGAFSGWDFHNTYYARISAAKVATFGAGYTVSPNLTVLHNSPAKDCPPAPLVCSDITVGTKELASKNVKVDVKNNNPGTDTFLTALNITWPQATNGNLVEVKFSGNSIYKPAGGQGGGAVNLTTFLGDLNRRKLGKGKTEEIKLIFVNNVSTNAANYTGTATFGDNCEKTILP